MKTASATIMGFEGMRNIRGGHCLTCKPQVKDEVRFVNKLFDVFMLVRVSQPPIVRLLMVP